VVYWWERSGVKNDTRKIMDDENVSKASGTFGNKDLHKYQQPENQVLRTKIDAQRKLSLTKQGLGLRLSTGTQDETKKTRKGVLKSSPTVVKHTFSSLRKHLQAVKGSLPKYSATEEVDEDETTTKENEPPTKNENEILTPPFVVDLFTQEENRDIGFTDDDGSTATIFVGEGGGWTSRPDPWTRVFQARSTEGGMDFYVDQEALGGVAGALLRDLTRQKSAAKNCGREY
jgi:hypothetical protein